MLQRSELMNLLKDMSADAELRITAYLAIMKCPDAETIAAITGVLEVSLNRRTQTRSKIYVSFLIFQEWAYVTNSSCEFTIFYY